MMKREILFRGKRIEDNQWVYGDLTQNPCPAIFENRGHRGESDVIPETVGQFTGLTDKNGKKIFEGDILAASCDNKTELFTCYWSEESAAFYLSNKFNPTWGRLSRLFEIASEDNWLISLIGNVFDSPNMAAKHD